MPVMCACERTGRANSNGSCQVARPIPIRQKASGSCTSLDVVMIRALGRSHPLSRSAMRKWARKLPAKVNSSRRDRAASDGLDAIVDHQAVDPASPERALDLLAGTINRAKARQIDIDDQSLPSALQGPKLIDPRRGPCQQNVGEVSGLAQHKLEGLPADAARAPVITI